MRIILLFMLISTLAVGQHSLIKVHGTNSFELGGQYAHSGTSLLGLWAAYNGPIRAEFSVDKFTESFNSGSILGARLTFPLINQSESFPVNILADTKYERFQSSGFSLSTYYGAALFSHQIRNKQSIISPLASAGYVKYIGGGDFKWTIGADVQIQQLIFGIEYGNAGGPGITYVNLGYKFGGKAKNVASGSIMDSELQEAKMTELEKAEARDAARLKKEMAQVDSLNKVLEMEALMDESIEKTEPESIPQSEAERNRIAQEEAIKSKLEAQKAEMEKLRKEQEEILSGKRAEMEKKKLEEQKREQQKAQLVKAQQEQEERRKAEELLQQQKAEEAKNIIQAIDQGNFSVQFFASSSPDKTFINLSHLSSIYIEKVEGKNLYRYKTGFFNSRMEAQRVANDLKILGYTGSFVKEE